MDQLRNQLNDVLVKVPGLIDASKDCGEGKIEEASCIPENNNLEDARIVDAIRYAIETVSRENHRLQTEFQKTLQATEELEQEIQSCVSKLSPFIVRSSFNLRNL